MGLASAAHLENDASSKVRGLLNGRRVIAWLGALSVLGGARSAPAESLIFRLSWVRGEGAEECPNAEQLTSAVEARLGRDAFSEPASRHIEGSVARSAGAWRVQLRVMGPDNAVLGSRELEATGPDCSSIAGATSLAIALTIDPHALDARHEKATGAAPEQPLPAPPATPSQETEPHEAEPSISAAPRAVPKGSNPSASLTGEVVPRGLFAVGILPEAGLGAELGTELRLGRALGLALSMAYLSEARTTGGKFGLSIAAGSLGLCFWALDRPRALLKVCGELMAGAIQVVVYEPIPTHPGEHLWLAPRLGPRFAYRLGERVSLELSALAVVPLVRERFSITGVETPVFQTAPLSLLSSLGLRVSIP
jgi:hypothetical protein